MAIEYSAVQQRQIPFAALVPFLLIVLGLTWGILATFIFLPEYMAKVFGELTGEHPLFFMAMYAPAIAAFILVTYHAGVGGVRNFLGRLLLWRCSAGWYAFLLVGIPLIYVGAAWFQGNLLELTFPFLSFQAFIGGLALFAIKGPVEEFGWRGVALPVLQRRFAPIWAGVIIGVIWGVWHLPAFLLSGTPQGAWSFTPFFAGTVAASVIMTALFNASRGSILLAALFHFQLINPLWPDGPPVDMALFVIAAVIIVWIHRRSMFGTDGRVTTVIPVTEVRDTPDAAPAPGTPDDIARVQCS